MGLAALPGKFASGGEMPHGPAATDNLVRSLLSCEHLLMLVRRVVRVETSAMAVDLQIAHCTAHLHSVEAWQDFVSHLLRSMSEIAKCEKKTRIQH